MSEEKPKKRKMNILGYLSIATTLGIMVYSKFTHTDGDIFHRLINGVLVYGVCFLGAVAATIVLWIGQYMANLFMNAIYDENKEPPDWENVDLVIIVFFVIIYVSELAGWIKI
jgi:Zn-dependent protease with chaperone function